MKGAAYFFASSLIAVSLYLSSLTLHLFSEKKETAQSIETQRILAQTRVAELEAEGRVIRDAVKYYTVDKGKPPQSLDDLMEAGYINQLPADLVASGYFDGMPRHHPPHTPLWESDPPMPPALGHSKSTSAP